MPEETGRTGKRKEQLGVVVSRSGSKTAVVKVVRLARHPLYGKVMRMHKKFHAHDEENKTKVGDKVRIVECRPLSRMKRWRIVEILSSGYAVEASVKS